MKIITWDKETRTLFVHDMAVEFFMVHITIGFGSFTTAVFVMSYFIPNF